MNEIYVPIKGYEDRYEISNKGNIRILKSRINTLKIPKILNPEIINKNHNLYVRMKYFLYWVIITDSLKKNEIKFVLF